MRTSSLEQHGWGPCPTTDTAREREQPGQGLLSIDWACNLAASLPGKAVPLLALPPLPTLTQPTGTASQRTPGLTMTHCSPVLLWQQGDRAAMQARIVLFAAAIGVGLLCFTARVWYVGGGHRPQVLQEGHDEYNPSTPRSDGRDAMV